MILQPSTFFKNFISLVLAVKSKVRREQQKNLSELLWLIFGQLVTLLLSVVSIKFITSIGPKDYGIFILLTSITTICIAVYFGPYEQAYVRFIYDYSDTELIGDYFYKDFSGEYWRVFLIQLEYFSFSCLLQSSYPSRKNIYLYSSCSHYLPLVNQPLTGMLNALRLRREVAIIQIAEKALQVMYSFSVRFLFNVTLYWSLMGNRNDFFVSCLWGFISFGCILFSLQQRELMICCSSSADE